MGDVNGRRQIIPKGIQRLATVLPKCWVDVVLFLFEQYSRLVYSHLLVLIERRDQFSETTQPCSEVVITSDTISSVKPRQYTYSK